MRDRTEIPVGVSARRGRGIAVDPVLALILVAGGPLACLTTDYVKPVPVGRADHPEYAGQACFVVVFGRE